MFKVIYAALSTSPQQHIPKQAISTTKGQGNGSMGTINSYQKTNLNYKTKKALSDY